MPSLVCLVWFSVLGGTALHLELSGAAKIAAAVHESPAAALFTTLDVLPWPFVTSILAVVLISLFFISGADAASVVMGMLSSRGSLKPSVQVVVIWGTLTGAVAIILLMTGGLSGLQTGAILSAGPFVLVLTGMCVAIVKSLNAEPGTRGTARQNVSNPAHSK